MDLAACHLFVALNLEVAYRFVESWWILGLHVPGCSTSVKISEDIFIISLAALYCALGRWQGIEVLYSLLHCTKSAEKPTLEMGSKLQPTIRNVFLFIYFYKRSICFKRFLPPSSRAHNCTYCFRYCQPILLLAATVEEIELISSTVAANSSIG